MILLSGQPLYLVDCTSGSGATFGLSTTGGAGATTDPCRNCALLVIKKRKVEYRQIMQAVLNWQTGSVELSTEDLQGIMS